MIRRLASLLAIALAVAPGCSSPPTRDFETRREAIEARILGLDQRDDPHVEAARIALEAPAADAEAVVAIDRVELGAEVLHEQDQKTRLRARLPIENLFQLPTRRDVASASADLALARLASVSLEQRIAHCKPSLAWRVHREHAAIYDAYASRLTKLLERNRARHASGAMDDVRGIGFDLEGEVQLARRAPPLAPPRVEVIPDALPDFDPTNIRLKRSPDAVHAILTRHQPDLETLDARARQYAALARHENAGRLPSPSAIDILAEPQPYPGDDRRFAGRLSFDIPFGREARARAKHYSALARAEAQRKRALTHDRGRAAQDAVARLNEFSARSTIWLALQSRANQVEQTADQWFDRRSVSNKAIAELLDEIYVARMTLLEARESAGEARCDLLQAAGLDASQWPTEPR